LCPRVRRGRTSVFKVVRKSDGATYAMKVVDISKLPKAEVRDAVNEIRLLASVRHAHVVGFMEAFLDAREQLCIVMEFCSGGDLAQARARVQYFRASSNAAPVDPFPLPRRISHTGSARRCRSFPTALLLGASAV
jgi:serine/threonine protein kinase